MAVAVRISPDLINDAKIHGRVNHRSIPGQIEFWAKIGKCLEENPDLTFEDIKEILIGIEELNEGKGTEYKFG